MGHCNLMLGDRAVGEVKWSFRGSEITVVASCPFEPTYIYRVELYAGDAVIPLGVMLPEKAQFIVKKQLRGPGPLSFFQNEVQARILRALPGEQPVQALPFMFSCLHPVGRQSWNDPLLQACLRECGEVLTAAQGDLQYIVVPYELGSECPFTALLCLCTYFEHQGKGYVAFVCDPDGFPSSLPTHF